MRSTMHISITAEKIFELGGWPITNSILLAVVALALLLLTGILLRHRLALVPGKLQSTFEIALENLLSLMDSILASRSLSERYLPLIATIFVFILTSNWLGLLPGIGSLGFYEESHGERVLVPLFRAPSADLNFTIALAIISVLSVNILGIAAIGFGKHFKKYFNFSNPILAFTGLLEFISEFVKIISFSFRLFGNVFAGEVLLTIVAVLVPYLVPLPFLLLEVFVGFIQAFIFSMLTLVFVAIAVREEQAH